MAEGVAETNMEGAAPAAPSAPTGSGLDLIGLTKVFPGGAVAVLDAAAAGGFDPAAGAELLGVFLRA